MGLTNQFHYYIKFMIALNLIHKKILLIFDLEYYFYKFLPKTNNFNDKGRLYFCILFLQLPDVKLPI